MKYMLAVLVLLTFWACSKSETAVTYDTHLFQQLASNTWVFDSSRNTDSAGMQTTTFASTTSQQLTTFSSQLYTIKNVIDTTVLDTTVYQIIYDNPNKVYYYPVGGLVIPGQYFIIDTVNTSTLITSGQDSVARTSSKTYYHAK